LHRVSLTRRRTLWLSPKACLAGHVSGLTGVIFCHVAGHILKCSWVDKEHFKPFFWRASVGCCAKQRVLGARSAQNRFLMGSLAYLGIYHSQRTWVSANSSLVRVKQAVRPCELCGDRGGAPNTTQFSPCISAAPKPGVTILHGPWLSR